MCVRSESDCWFIVFQIYGNNTRMHQQHSCSHTFPLAGARLGSVHVCQAGFNYIGHKIRIKIFKYETKIEHLLNKSENLD